MKRLSVLLFLAPLALTACERPEDAKFRAAREQATKTVAAATAGGQEAGGLPQGELELRWTVRNQVKGEEIICAYAASKTPPPAGQRPKVIPVIVRGDKTIRAEDVGPEAFSKMQDELCGPDWVKPQP